MEQFTTSEKKHLITRLQELDTLYHSCSLEAYEQKWEIVGQQVQHTFPGFATAYAEIYTAGSQRIAT